MHLLKTVLRLAIAPIVVLAVSAQSANADEVYSSSYPNGVVTGSVNADLIVDSHCIIAPGAYIKGNIKQLDPSAHWTIRVQSGAKVDGNIEELGFGSVRVSIASGQFFNGSIKEAGVGGVSIVVATGGLYDGNVEENGSGSVSITVNGSGLFNGNTYEKDAGDLRSMGTGMYNGTTNEDGAGGCGNTILNFNGSPCE